jgi:poly-gamma-glutamate capsule biosynthesis protein CapA/YwtB (metallophosphatase superfamily)
MLRKAAILLMVTCLQVVNKPVPAYFMQPDPFFSGPFSSANITLFLSGDVMTGRGIDQVLPQHVDPMIYESYVKDARDYVRLAEKKNGPIKQPISYTYIWGDALEVWQTVKPDLKIINLETSVTSYPEPWPGKEVQYRMHPANVQVLKTAGFNFCTLANNHTLDWQRPGLLETLQTLQQAGIPYAGAGKDLAEARKPSIFKLKNSRVLIFAYGSESSGIPSAWAATADRSGVNLLPDLTEKSVNLIKARIKAVKRPGDVVIFTIHWGSNWGYDIPPNQRTFAHQLIDEAGVDLIHGHSSHHPRGLEVYRDKLILYGAGDFINDYEGIGEFPELRGDLSLMYFPKIDPVTGKLVSLKMVPMQTRNFQLHSGNLSDAKWLEMVLDRESNKFNTRVKLTADGSLSAAW